MISRLLPPGAAPGRRQTSIGAAGGAVDWFDAAFRAGDTKILSDTRFVGLPLVLPAQPGIHPREGHVIDS